MHARAQANNSPKYLSQLIKEVSTFLCYEATTDLKLEACSVKTRVAEEAGQRISERVGVVPVLRGGLGMVEAMTEVVSNAQVSTALSPTCILHAVGCPHVVMPFARCSLLCEVVPPSLSHPHFGQVWHLGIYRDKKSLLPVEYYNKLPKKVTVTTVFVLDPMPISGATAVAAIDILKAWGESLKPQRTLEIRFICIVAAEPAIKFISEAHPDIKVHVGLIDTQSVRRRPRRALHAVCVASGAHCPRSWLASPRVRLIPGSRRLVISPRRSCLGWATSPTDCLGLTPRRPRLSRRLTWMMPRRHAWRRPRRRSTGARLM